MPMLGLTMEEGTVAEWLKHEGDTVRKDEPLLTVEMDKGTVEVPAPVAGVLSRILVQEGTTVAVKTPIAEIESSSPVTSSAGSSPSASSPAPSSSSSPAPATSAAPVASGSAAATGAGSGAGAAPAGSPTASGSAATGAGSGAASGSAAATAPAGGPGDLPPSSPSPTPTVSAPAGGATAPGPASRAPRGPERTFSSPRARMRARELGLDLARLRGTGPHGRIVEADVLAVTLSGAERVVATPLARRLAQEHGVDISTLQGTGPGGRITQDDVLRAAAAVPSAEAAAAVPSAEAAAARAPAAIAAAEATAEPAREPLAVAPLSRVRRITAERMAASAQATARVTLFLDADFSEVSRFRAQLQPEFARVGVAKLPWDAIIAKAVGLALQEHPNVQAQWTPNGEGLRRPAGAHVGIAVALEPEGLVVPVLRDAHTRSLRELASDLLALADRARAGRLSPAEMQGGTFTITNLGAYRVDGFTPIVNPPETAILGVGRIADKPVVIEGRVEPRTMCTLSLSFDHRVVDGAPAAAFLARLAELLERPYALLGI